MVDGVAVDLAVFGSEVLVLPVVILDRDREADRGEAVVQKFRMVAAAAEAVVAPDLHDVETDVQPVGEAVEEARDVAAGRVILAAEAALLRGQIFVPLPAWPFGKDADDLVVTQAIGAACIADDVVV